MSTRKVNTIPGRKVRQITRQAIYNPAAGLNNFGAPNLIKDREWADLDNIQFDESGVARKRFGFTEWSSSLTAAKGLGELVTEDYNQVITIDSGVLKYTADGSSWTSDNTVTFDSTVYPDFTQARGACFIWDGVSGGAQWDGATLSRPGTMPKAKFSVFYSSYHIASGVEGKPSRVYISVLDDSSDFTNASTTLHNSTEVPGATVFADTGANFIDIQENDGDEIKALSVFQDIVIIFKQFAIYQLSFDDAGDPVVLPITTAAGCVSHKTVKSVENDLYFLSREGVRVLGNEANYFSAIRTKILSKPISPLTDIMDESAYSLANAIYYDNEYILTIPDQAGTLLTTIVYNIEFKAWTKWSNIEAQAMVKFINSSNEQKLLFLKTDGDYVYEFTPDLYSDNGSPIDAYLLSKVFDFKSPDITKYFVDLGLMFRTISGEVDIEIYTEGNVLLGGTAGIGGNPVTNGLGITMLGYAMLGTGGGDATTQEAFADTIRRVVLRTKSTTIRFKISNARNNENFVLLGYIHAFYPFTHFLFDSSKKIYL